MPSGVGEVQLDPQKTAFRLPLVCRQGRPTALEHMSRRNLVTFVTFVLHHARTVDERTAAAVRQLAQMWPEVLHTAGSNGDALSKCPPGRLRRLVRSWYRMLGCELLLPLSAALERENNRGRLRLQRNGDGTSSLLERLSDRLVVTYRDDSLYDGGPAARDDKEEDDDDDWAPPPGTPSSEWTEPAAAATQPPPPPPPPDCAQCGAQFVTLAAAMAHERLCDGMGADSVSDCESVRSEPTSRTVGQAQFLSYLGMAPAATSKQQAYQSPSGGQQQQQQRPWPTAELLLRLSRTDLSSPMGRRMLSLVGRQPALQGAVGGGAAARLDRLCCSRVVRAPAAVFPVTWSAPRQRAQPRQYSFTARQRAERAAAIRTGLSARAKVLYGRVRPCSVVLTRLKPVDVPGTVGRRWPVVHTDHRQRQRHPPGAARVLLQRLTETEIAVWLSGGSRAPPATPSGKTAGTADRPPPPPLSRPNGAARRRYGCGSRGQLLRDECKAIRDAHFFRLLSSDGRVTRSDHRVTRSDHRVKRSDHKLARLKSRRRMTSEKRPARSNSEGDSLVGGSAGVSRLAVTPPYCRRMSLLGSMQGRLHSILKGSDSHFNRQLQESDITDIADGVKLDSEAAWSASPGRLACRKPSSSCEKPSRAVSEQVSRRGSTAARDVGRRLNNLMADECKTLRDSHFVQLLNRPSRTTRSAASECSSPEWRRVSVWLHWPGFAREPDHQTPVKHARAAGQPRGCRMPVVRLERLFRQLEPAADGGPSERRLTLLSAGDSRTASCRRRLSLETTDAKLTAQFVSRCRRQTLPGAPPPAQSVGDGVLSAGDGAAAPPPPPPRRLSAGHLLVANDGQRTTDTSWYQGMLRRPLRPPSRSRKALSESGTRHRLNSVSLLLDTDDNGNIDSTHAPDVQEKRPRCRPRKAL